MAALSAIRTALYVRLGERNNRTVSNAEALTLINNGIEEWVSNTEELRAENAYSVTANQYDYAAPTDCIRPLFAEWGPTKAPIEVISAQELQDRGGYGLNSVGVPRFLVYDGVGASMRFRLYPAPSSTSATTTILDTGGISSSDTTIGLTAVSGMRSPAGWVGIENEKILYQNISSLNLTLCRRAMGGTTAASHADGTTVTQLDLHVVYLRRPALLSADADVPEIAGNHLVLVEYALWQALEVGGRVNAQYEHAKEEWLKKLGVAKATASKARTGSPTVMRNLYY